MKKLSFLIALLLMAGVASAAPKPKVSIIVGPGFDLSLLMAFPTPPTTNTLTVTFNYDYSQPGSNGCVVGATGGCVANFLFFESVSGVQGATLLTIPASVGATQAQTGISGSVIVPQLAPGSHIFGLVAQTPDLVASVPAFAPPVVAKSAPPTAATGLGVAVK